MMRILCAAFLACAPPPAPQGISGAAAWLYENYERADAAALGDALQKLHDDTDGPELEDGFSSLIGPLAPQALADVGLEGKNDPSTAQGMYVATLIDCPLDKVEKLHTALNQDELHSGYKSYARVYTSSDADFFAGRADRVSWKTDYAIEPAVGDPYSATIHGEARRFAAVKTFAQGRFLLGRAFLPAPGVFPAGSQDAFPQDYQLDVFYEREPGKTIHLFAVWRELRLGGLSTKDGVMQSFMMGGFINGDKDTARNCKAL
jgi:hypothetical protein